MNAEEILIIKKTNISARNIDYSRGVVYKPNKKSDFVSDCSDNRETIIELKVLKELN